MCHGANKWPIFVHIVLCAVFLQFVSEGEMELQPYTSWKPRLAELLKDLVQSQGLSASLIREVRFIREDQPRAREPMVYEPSIIILAQGRMRVYLGDQVYTYDPHNYMVLSVPLPFECETEASAEHPLLAVAITVDPAVLGELLMEMEDSCRAPSIVGAVYSTPLTEDLACATERLLECLQSAMDSRILGQDIVREMTYRVLCGEQGGALRALAARHSRFGQIARVLRRVHQEYERELDVESLARDANMSVSNFHHNFKAVTSTSPLQYLKSIRLHKARILMRQDGLNASSAAARVGYVSLSQFSREFKRFFGVSPANDTAQLRRGAG
jgi:AraC-like DNA-binding protein